MIVLLNSGPDLWIVLGLFGVTALAALAYAIRVSRKGRAHFDRVDRQGGSKLLGKGVMEGAYWFFQPLGRFLLWLGVTPNQISWGSLFLGACAGVALCFGHFGSAAAFSAFSAIFDALDGMVARLSGTQSDAGEVLDASVDRYAEFFFFGGLLVYYREVPALLVLTLFALIGAFMVSYSTAKAEALQVSPPKGSMRRPERAVYLTVAAALCPVTIPMFESFREYPIALGHPMIVALGLIAVIGNYSAVERLVGVAKLVRAREEAERQQASVDARHASTVESSDEDGIGTSEHAHANSTISKK